jgi:hypothetical protein
VVIPYFDKLLNAHEWPPDERTIDPGEANGVVRVPYARARYAPILQKLASNREIAVKQSPLYAVISLRSAEKFSAVPPIRLGEKLTFQSGSEGLSYLQSGWSSAEPWGIWSAGKTSTMRLRVRASGQKDLAMTIEGKCIVARRHRSQTVEISANKIPVGKIRYLSASVVAKTVLIPAVLFRQSEGYFNIEFWPRNPKSPFELGISGDKRTLGFGLVSLRFD